MMKKVLIIMLVLSSLTFSATNAIFTSIPLVGKSAAMGGALSLDSPIKYSVGYDNWRIEMSQKKNLGEINYQTFEIGKTFKNKLGIGIKYEVSGDLLKTNKMSFGFSKEFKYIGIGSNLNLYSANVSNEESASDEIKKEAELQGISYKSLLGSKTDGFGLDVAILFNLDENISLEYFMKNVNSNLNWKIKNGDNYKETLERENIISLKYNKKNIEAIAELDNGKRFNIGFSRNYYDKLDLRVGMSRNLNSKDNINAQKSYTVGIGFIPLETIFNKNKVKLGIDIGYEMKYFGNDEIFNGNSQDDITFSTYFIF